MVVGIGKDGSTLLAGSAVKIKTDLGFYVWGRIISIKDGSAKVDIQGAAPGSPVPIQPSIIEIICSEIEKRNEHE